MTILLECPHCKARCWVKAQSIEYGYAMHEDVNLDEAEWTRGEWPECEHPEDDLLAIDVEGDACFPDDH